MCGILAYFNRNGISEKELKQSLNALQRIKHRGPDGEGIVLINSKTGKFHNLITDETPNANLENKVNLSEALLLDYDLIMGHRRLSIIDVSTNGHQPMYHQSGNWIIFNGEIYNYIELRDELKKEGYVFRTESDTEVIHVAYLQWGERCVEKFNGMFSILIFNSGQKKLFVTNDRFGVKPLYYFKTENKIAFISELKQAKDYDVDFTLRQEQVNDFFDNYTDYNELTIVNEITRFKPSHFCTLNLQASVNPDQRCYYEVKVQDHSNKNINEVSEQLKELLTSAVKLRLRSDVPVGFASSGGLDSSAILYLSHSLLKQHQPDPDVTTFSAVFPGKEGDESEFIKIVENDLKVRSNYVNPVEKFNLDDFEKHIYHQDLPVLTTSFYAGWCVSRLVKESNVKVLLVGQGADEILAGYHHHFYRHCRHLILRGRISSYVSLVKKYAELKGLDHDALHRLIMNEVKLALKLKVGLAKFSSKLEKNWNSLSSLYAVLKADLTETTLPFYLRADDRNSMAFSIESRQPFLDYRLVDFCMSLPDELKLKDGWQKWILRYCMNELPEKIRFRKDKKGFTTPENEWMKQYKTEFDTYLKYIPQEYQGKCNANLFKCYALGAWQKLHKAAN